MEKAFSLNIEIPRGQTQKEVNRTILAYLHSRFPGDAKISFLDLPCGNLEFLACVKSLFPFSDLTGADLHTPKSKDGINFHQMDLTKSFTLSAKKKFDVVSSISGVMMFSNTLSFIENCSARIKNDGTFILTNDNNTTIKDRLAFFFLGRYRIFNSVFEDKELMTENVPINELVRLVRAQGINIESIEYTSFYPADLIFLPIALVVCFFQWIYLKRLKTQLPTELIKQMYPFKHLLCRHYIIKGTKCDKAL